MEELVKFIASKLVDEPEAVRVTSTPEDNGVVRLVLSVAAGDVGKVIGKQGRIARSLRAVVRAASKDGAHYILDIDSGTDE